VNTIFGILSLLFWFWVFSKVGKWVIKNPDQAAKGVGLLRNLFRK
jgi:hypothetical protein